MPRNSFIRKTHSRVQQYSDRALAKKRESLIKQLQTKGAKGRLIKLPKAIAHLYRTMLAEIDAEIERRQAKAESD
jgi:hypothetical protein